LDLDIELFKTSKPEFYSQYKTTRIIDSTRGSVTSVLGNVSDLTNGEPIKGVTLAFTLISNGNGLLKSAAKEITKPIVKKSAGKGNFRIPNLAEGTYKVLVSKIGFKEQIITITVANGETTNIKVELERA